MRTRCLLIFFCAVLATASVAQEQRFADLGDFKLESGETLRDCRIGYRTVGVMNADKSNMIVMPTWAGGTTEQLASDVGPDKLADSSKYYVILIDALSNGVSSSPSNSKQQPHMHFPRITIADMVSTEHDLLTRVLHINHVRAVMGISMGGMQTFQWMVQYPDFMDKAIPIVGSPRLAPYDLLDWSTQLGAIMNDPTWQHGDHTREPERVAEYEFGALMLTSPEHVNRSMTREEVMQKIAEAARSNDGQDANNKIRQTQAMMALDVSQRFNGSVERAAATVKAQVLVVVSRQDHVVTPQPAIDFARLLKVEPLILDSDCGHLAPGCEAQRMDTAVAQFLAR
ncbi:MAG TPA: alpha/beta fold hydrolase [Terriglobales bacterium]|nr:alpha/beta fold hydrolase [Terriglobales bacterium]